MKYNILTILILVCTSIFSQTEINNIIPLAPNTAAFVRYGEVPVNNFTGTANISIPIYNIKTNEFNFPLELSYHTGGNKVDDIASWVGLGWSLGTIPIISRSINGIADEGTGGFMSKYEGYSTQELYMMDKNNINKLLYLDALADGTADSEPDIFYFNILGKNGKFIYDQEHNQFVTLEESQIKIIYENGFFKLITEEGYEYTFFERENTYVNGGETTVAWYVTKIVSPSKNEEIVFEYDLEVQTFKTPTPKTKFIFTGGIPSETDDLTKGPVTTITTIYANLLKKISFNGGTLEFTRNTIERLDLQGGYSLKNIKLKDFKKNEIFNYEFEYKYMTGRSCYRNEKYTNEWMLLEKFKNTTLTNSIEHSFLYNESYMAPCRYSPAQDYWGYYNGADGNLDLIPTTFLKNNPLQIKGADRFVNPAQSQFGILKKIIYPTGGFTEFDFENNDTYSTKLPEVYLDDVASIDGSKVIGIEENYEVAFTIDNPPDIFLNGNNPLGGAYANFTMGCNGCGLKNGIANANINFSLTRLPTSTSPAYTFYISRNFNSHLQNGDYILNAYIYNAGQDLEINDFFVSVTWNKLNPNKNGININKYIGGLRIKEIRSYADALAVPIIKTYKYKQDYFSEWSSGKVFSEPRFVFEDNVIVRSDCVGGFCNGYYTRLKSYNNTQQVTFSGSNIGYETVIEESNDPMKTGVTIYKYTNMMDVVSARFPYPPAISMELYRGKIKEISYYKKNNAGTLIPVETKEFEYNTQLSNKQIGFFKNMFAFKIGQFAYNLTEGIIGSRFDETHLKEAYEISTNINLLSSEKTTTYSSTGNLITTKSYNYNSQNHLLLTSQSSKSSTQETLETKYFYPQDAEMSNEPFAKELIAANRIGAPLNIQAFRGGNKLSEQKTVYDKSVATSNLLLPAYILENKGTATLNAAVDKKISYDLYDDKGNILQYTQEGATPVSIVWGYDKTLPVVKIENLAYKTIPKTLINEVQTASSDKGSESSIGAAMSKFFYNFNIGLSNTMITKYMYKPLVGVSCIIDPTNVATYYDYDNFNRLKFVKDWQMNVLESYCYNYKGQIMDCSLDVAPVYSNIAMSKTYDKYNCPLGQVGPVWFSVSAGIYTSLISQADADAKALAYLDKEGQLNANRSSYCVYMNAEKSTMFYKNNCPSGAISSGTLYTVPARKYISYISQDDSDSKAQSDIDKNGQIYANTNGVCTFKNKAISRLFTKNDCEESALTESITYRIEEGKHISNISQADADAMALNDLNSNGQSYANAHSNCTYNNIAVDRFFVKNDCGSSGKPSEEIHYTIEAGKYTSGISQADADNQALAEGQALANTNGSCGFKNVAKSGLFTKNDCSGFKTPEVVSYVVVAGTYTSATSQEAADNLAQQDVDANGQEYANLNGGCSP